jgi:hypothetical protein
MSEQVAAGVVLIATPILFNVGFTLLGQRFDYPDILRRPTHEVLERFRAGGTSLVLVWWALALGVVFGVLASAVQFLGLIRWTFLVPYLAKVAAEEPPESPRGQAVDVVFQSFNRYLGVAVGEHLGYAFTGIWSILAGISLIDSAIVPDWLGVIGIVAGPLFLLCSLEFVGRAEEKGWKPAAVLTPITYVLWSVWLLAVGVALLV